MVRVPVTTGSAREIQPLGGDRLRYSGARDFVSPAVERFGEELQRTGDRWDRIEATYDEADAMRLDNELREYERERLRTGESAYLASKGFDAGKGREEVVSDLGTAAENLLGSARSDRARAMAKRAFDARLGAAEETIASHAVGQMEVAHREQSEARIAGAITDAVDARGTDQFEMHLGLAQSELARRGSREGWSDEQFGQKSDELVSNIYGQAVLAIDAEDGEPTRALEFLEKNSALLLPGEEARLKQQLTPRVDAAWADELVKGGGLETFIPAQAKAEPATPGEATISLAIPFGGRGKTVAGGKYGAARGYGGHTGVDYAGLPVGAPVNPSAPGRVIVSEEKGGYGHRVEVDHGVDAQGRRIVTTYSHLDARKVNVGDVVDATTELGGVGSSGGNYGTHLHWEVMVDGVKVDPSTVADLRVDGAGAAPDPRMSSADMRAAVDAYVAANPGIPERRRQALYAAADRAVNRARADRAEAEGEADRRMTEWLLENAAGPDDLRSMGQVPAAIRAGISPGMASAINSRIQATAAREQARADAAAAQQAKAIEKQALIELESLTDEELMQTDLNRYVGRADPLVLARKFKRQKDAAAKPGSIIPSSKVIKATNRAAEIVGIKREDDPREWAELRSAIEREIAEIPADKLDDETLRAIAIEQTQKVVISGSGYFGDRLFGDKKRRYELKPGETYKRLGDSIPPGAQDYLARNFPDASPAEKIELFERAKARNLEWTFD